MKGLHNIVNPAAKWTWRWMSAYQTRRGRRHLIRLPVVEVDISGFAEARNRNRMPYNMRYASTTERIEWLAQAQRDHRNLVIPARAFTEVPEEQTATAERYCDMEQAAQYYEIETHQQRLSIDHEARPRGYCDICWREYPHYRQYLQETRHARGFGSLRGDREGWERHARSSFSLR